MVNKKILFVILLVMSLALVFTGCSTDNWKKIVDNGKIQEQKESKNKKTSGENLSQRAKDVASIEEQVENMTLEEKIGQMVMVGLEGFTITEKTRTLINNYYVGGFIILGENVKASNQLLALLNSLKGANAKNKVPLFLSIDEEGGRISRMPDDLMLLPTNETVGKINSSELSWKIGSILAEELKSFGLNMNFAPVLDINSNPKNPVIGDRSFGSDAKLVSKLGLQTMQGLQAGGVIPVIKHFPGHGDTSVDSHVGLPSINHDLERLNKFEFIPFKEAINKRADAVMIAHILLNKIDPQAPASLSKIIITDILRKELNFDGVVITDDLTMGAIADNYAISDAVVKAVTAGNDIVLVCHGHDNAVAALEALKKAVENGIIPEASIDESVYRILKLKQKYNLSDQLIKAVDINKINDKIKNLDLY